MVIAVLEPWYAMEIVCILGKRKSCPVELASGKRAWLRCSLSEGVLSVSKTGWNSKGNKQFKCLELSVTMGQEWRIQLDYEKFHLFVGYRMQYTILQPVCACFC